MDETKKIEPAQSRHQDLPGDMQVWVESPDLNPPKQEPLEEKKAEVVWPVAGSFFVAP